MRLLCSPHLSAIDAEALVNVPVAQQPAPLDVAAASLAELTHGNDLERRAVASLRALIDAHVLEVRFVTSGKSGLFHDKLGVFTDDQGLQVSFIGSANETAAAWSGFANHEQIETFESWAGEEGSRRCSRHEAQFDETWLGLRRGLSVTEASAAAAVIRSVVPAESIDEVLVSLRETIEIGLRTPEAIPLRDYQSEVLQAWERAEHRGLVVFATGGGKTRTALEAIRRWTATGQPALVLVPSELLHKQWHDELRNLLPDAVILLAGAGSSRRAWLDRLADYTRADPSLEQRVVLATYQTAATAGFLEKVRGGGHLLVVGDEVHRVGAPDTRSILLNLDAGARLGMSATPERFGDPVGTRAILDYFGDVLAPEFTLSDALEAGVLVPYDYAYSTCALSEDEQTTWDKFTLQIAQEIARNKGDMTERALHLARQRARVAKRAGGKAAIAKDVLVLNHEDGDRWLVYCNDVEHLREVRSEIDGLGFEVLEYHSQDGGDHDATLSYFTNRGGVLLAIKCLDEGIDIPLINKALILASSTNPREYIQRRGRVLRRSAGKYSAQLFDVIVTGADGLAVTPNEVRRAMEFARDARNLGVELYLEHLVPSSGDSVRSGALTDVEEFES
jgi:superfamily II DNA or RNA helicase